MIKRVAITGANSMIGINMIKYLLSSNIKVLAFARTVTNDLAMLCNDSRVQLIQCELKEYYSINTHNESCDLFVHLAWMGTFGTQRDDVYMQSKNIEYTLDAVNLASKLNCKTFLGVGSQAEYGIVNRTIRYDTSNNPFTGYGIAKYTAGKMSRVLAKNLGIKHVWTRIFSVYGPYDNPKTMIMSSISSMLKGAIPKYTEATQMWNYLFVEDAVRGIFLAAVNGKNGNVYNIANSENKPLRQYIEKLRNIACPDLKLRFGEIPYNGKVVELSVDTTSEKKQLEFSAEYSFEEGIKKTIAWYKENMI